MDGSVQPVAVDPGGVRVVGAEPAVGQGQQPGVALVVLPAFHNLRAGNHRAQGHLRAVDNGRLPGSRIDWVYLLPVDAGSDQHLISGRSNQGRLLNAAEGPFLAAVTCRLGIAVNIIYHSEFLLLFSVYMGTAAGPGGLPRGSARGFIIHQPGAHVQGRVSLSPAIRTG